MRATTVLPALFSTGFAALLSTQFPHLLIPLVSTSPNTAYGTQYDATISYSTTTGATQLTEVSFDVPSNAASTCRVNFLINTNPTKNAPRTLSGVAPYTFNITRLEPKINKDTDTWNSHPGKTDLVARYKIDQAGRVTTLQSNYFDCRKGQVAQFLIEPDGHRDLKFYWFELDYPADQGGAHGVVYEMYG